MNASGVVLGVGATALGAASLYLAVPASQLVGLTITSMRGIHWSDENSKKSPILSFIIGVISLLGIIYFSIPAIVITLGSSVAGGLAICTIVTLTTSGRVGVICGIVTFLLETTAIVSAGHVFYDPFRKDLSNKKA